MGGLCSRFTVPTLAPTPAPTHTPTPVPGSSICADQPGQPCTYYKSIGYCKFDTAKEACTSTCGLCNCADQPRQPCAHYKSIGYCKFGTVKGACAKTCGLCSRFTVPTLAPTPAPTPTPTPVPGSSICADQPGQPCTYYKS